MSVILETTLGDITVDLFTDERPRASLNFLKLCKIKYYNYCLFHSVQRNFMAQTGDPTGTGKGGHSVFSLLYGDQAKFFEAETKPRLKHRDKGTLSMVNNGENMHGSQFFITLGADLDYLNGVHTVFGEVVEGFDVLDKISEAICDDEHRPYQDIRISHTVIIEDPFDDPPDLSIPDRSPEPTKEQLESGRIGADEEIDETKGRTMEEIQEAIEEKEMKAGTQILEMVGDIPDAEIKPPDNVLFVCKLNPVTTDEDLEIIFSRFGSIKSCEVIRDQKSGESLQFAFVEFENVEDCERAYFKMDNVLIDDRRIHVDFSQSVAKVKWAKQGARPVLEETKRSDAKPKYAIKGQQSNSRYNLVFDEEEEDQQEELKRRKKKKHKRSSDDEDKFKKKQRKEDNDEKYRSKKETRESRGERSDEVYVDAWQRHARSEAMSRERHARRDERYARNDEWDYKKVKRKHRDFDSDSEENQRLSYRERRDDESPEEYNRNSKSSKDRKSKSEHKKPGDERKSRGDSTHSSRDNRHSSYDKHSSREYDKRSSRDCDRHSSKKHRDSGHKHRERDR